MYIIISNTYIITRNDAANKVRITVFATVSRRCIRCSYMHPLSIFVYFFD